MEMYLLKSAACLAVLLLFYKLLLEKENMHVFKRFFLLTSVLAALFIPLITFTTYVQPATETFNSYIFSSEVSSEVAAKKWDLSYIFFGIYLLGVLFFSFKFIRNLRNLIVKIRTNPKVKVDGFINVLLSENVQPHTFFSFLFFNKEKFIRDEIPQDVKIHEQAHARQKHSLDVLFVELLQIIFWFNPLIFFLKDAVKLNHEFLADREVIKKGIKLSGYQQTLLAYSSRDLQSDLVNPINYSSIKKRFTVMKTQTSKNAVWARSLLLIPLLAGLVYSCSSNEILERESALPASVQEKGTLELNVDKNGSIFLNDKKIAISELQDIEKGTYTGTSINASMETPQAAIDELVEVIRLKGVRTISVCTPGDRDFMNSGSHSNNMEKATPEMVVEFNKLVKHYNSVPKDNLMVKQEDANRIMSILSRMTSEQRAKAEKINFNVPPPPPPPPAPAPPEAGVNSPPSPPLPQVSASEAVSTLENPQIPPPPPPPTPPTYEDLVERGATFFYNGKLITPEEARNLVEVERKVNIHIIDIDGKAEVRLTDKKKKD